MNIVDNIKEIAKKNNMNLSDVAEAANLGPKTISNWRKHNPQSKSLQKVANVLNVSVDDLLIDSSLKNKEKIIPEQVHLQNKIEVADLTTEELEKLDSYLEFLKSEHARMVNGD